MKLDQEIFNWLGSKGKGDGYSLWSVKNVIVLLKWSLSWNVYHYHESVLWTLVLSLIEEKSSHPTFCLLLEVLCWLKVCSWITLSHPSRIPQFPWNGKLKRVLTAVRRSLSEFHDVVYRNGWISADPFRRLPSLHLTALWNRPKTYFYKGKYICIYIFQCTEVVFPYLEIIILWFNENNNLKAVKNAISGHAHLTYSSVPVNYIKKFHSNIALLG